jgi:hypothetical protein
MGRSVGERHTKRIACTMKLDSYVLWYHIDSFVECQAAYLPRSAIQHSTISWYWWGMVLPAVTSLLDNGYVVTIGSAHMTRK